MTTQQVIQLSVVNIPPLPPGCETFRYSRSPVQQALWKFGKHGEHRLLEPLYLKRLHAELREEVKAEANNVLKMQRWMQLEGEFEGPVHWYKDYEINVRFVVGEDLGKAREVTRRTTTVLNMFIPANRTAWVASQDLDPGVSDLYLRLANGALINISWWDTVPAPLPGSGDDIVLEVHARTWPGRPNHIIPPTPTAQCVECEFYAIHSAIPATFWLPVLPGGWIIPAHYKELLGQQGFHKGVATVVVFGEPKRTMALKVTTLAQPVAVSSAPARPPLLVWRALCAHCFAASPPESYHSLSHFC
ncbi:uncharacterized protein SCHCODRAFT_02668526 [Schizophyllum commune H4-8]|uniref:uncharacterized protein n=1 Tax=Schizophyllum commune (strain H4-8 / FGSC 9210) TaxID=578458 RepID=UPI0021602D64|nr:uncharacterized protein SCHCODRAFT_02668526 [Schizophyllum commune H4-8]KAI5891127.1 hypothetical protein SCHCODRAFT_02668526 [Schizophyllum commune H4-8]